MKLIISREALLAPLQSISGVVEKKQTMPVLSNILMVANQGELKLTGTNMEVELVCTIDQVDVEVPGQITVPARKLSDICRSLSDQAMLELTVEGERLHVRAGKSHFTLSTLPAEHFPNIEESPQDISLTLPQADFKKMLEATSFAMAQQDVRYYLNGMLLEMGATSIRAVATDGHRLAMSSIDIIGTTFENNRQVIVPRKGILELARLLTDPEGTINISFSDSHVRSEIGSYTFTSKLIDGKYPDYQAAVPSSTTISIQLDRIVFRDTLARVAILSNEKFRGVRVNLANNQMRITANNPEQEEAEEILDVDFQGDDIEIGFNVSYVIDVLNTLKCERVRISMTTANASALVEDCANDEAQYVVMPIRL